VLSGNSEVSHLCPEFCFLNSGQFVEVVRPCIFQTSSTLLLWAPSSALSARCFITLRSRQRDYILGNSLFLCPTGLIIIVTYGHEQIFWLRHHSLKHYS
jgi:hypothetical protein